MNPGAGAPDDPFQSAASAFDEGRIGDSEAMCRRILKQDPVNIDAICLLSDVAQKYGRTKEANALLSRAVEVAPDFAYARLKLAHVLHERLALDAALEQLDHVKRLDIAGAWSLNRLVLTGHIFTRMGRNEQAIANYEAALAHDPDSVRLLMSLGHARKTLGDLSGAVAAYRAVVAAAPGHGDAWWSLANLKTFRFSAADIDTMREQALSDAISRDDFFHTSFALGKALEDAGEFEQAFVWYQRGNAVRRRLVRYSAKRNRGDIEAIISFFTKPRLQSFDVAGASDPAPIFVVGLPRAGSTLIEQILASHSFVEGTQELPDLMSIAIRLSGRKHLDETSAYPGILADMSPAALRQLGEEYLERTRVHRSGAPYFIDKLPNNFMHVGLLHLILPNAKVIDARRNPMDCCFSCYKQLFAKGQNFTYSLKEIGAYYRDYLYLMEHWDRVLPGKVLRVLNEDVISDPEGQIRRLLAYCRLPFEASCLLFYENQRPVRTPSADQVRRPVNAKGVGRWRAFEAQLMPLAEALEDAGQRWNAPQFGEKK
jgi:tetratricopeptide (TPR) repeat protein